MLGFGKRTPLLIIALIVVLYFFYGSSYLDADITFASNSLGPDTKWADVFMAQQRKLAFKKIIPQVCEFSSLRYPVRIQEISSGTGLKYKSVLHPPNEDQYISDNHWNNGVPGKLAFEGNYHIPFSKTMDRIRHVKQSQDLIIVDIGANIGVHSTFFALKGARVFSFEPSPTNFRLLQCAAYANGLTNIILNNVALSNETTGSGGWCISTPETFNQGHKVLTKDCATKGTAVDGKDNSEGIRTIPLDAYWSRVLRHKRIDMIKIDIEGHEPFVFAGAKKMFQTAPPYAIFAEFQPEASEKMGFDPVEFIKTIWSYGYTVEIQNNDIGFKQSNIDTVEVAKELVEHIKSVHKSVGLYLVDLVFIHRDLKA